MTENLKERAIRQLAEVERVKAEVREAMVAANAADELAKRKSEELSRLEVELREADESQRAARALVAVKQDELNNLLAALADEWRDKTNPPN